MNWCLQAIAETTTQLSTPRIQTNAASVQRRIHFLPSALRLKNSLVQSHSSQKSNIRRSTSAQEHKVDLVLHVWRTV